MAIGTLAFIYRALVAALVFSPVFLTAKASDSFLEQSFGFSWDSQLAVPVPVTTQCDTLSISWSRSGQSGPNPVAPYYLQVYTSAYVFPFIISAGSNLNFDWAVPFGPGTLYQICMFDSQGNTGGCQAVYTVIANTSSSTLSCSNSTINFPLGPLDVDAKVANGALSQYGWVDQCTDITVTPKNGTGPYTFTVAPALHPPWNITSSTATAMKWTVALSWASPFFISVADSAGNMWSYGPLHSGGGGPTSCLSAGNSTSSSDSNGIPAGAAAGAGVGGLAVGLIAGGLLALCFFRKREQKRKDMNYMGIDPGTPGGSPNMGPYSGSSRYGSVPLGGRLLDSGPSSMIHRSPSAGEYQVEPFIMPGEGSSGPLSPTSETRAGSVANESGKQLYVVHHDGGRAPVTIYHADGTEVVELPPRYADGGPSTGGHDSRSRSSRSETAMSNSDTRLSMDANSRPPSEGPGPSFSPLQQRRPQPTPKKPTSRSGLPNPPS